MLRGLTPGLFSCLGSALLSSAPQRHGCSLRGTPAPPTSTALETVALSEGVRNAGAWAAAFVSVSSPARDYLQSRSWNQLNWLQALHPGVQAPSEELELNLEALGSWGCPGRGWPLEPVM